MTHSDCSGYAIIYCLTVFGLLLMFGFFLNGVYVDPSPPITDQVR